MPQHEDAVRGGPVAEVVGEPAGDGGDGGVERGGVLRPGAVARALAGPRRPPGGSEVDHRRGRGGRGCGGRGGRGDVVLGHQPRAARQHVGGQVDDPGGEGDDVEADAEPAGRGVGGGAVLRRAQVDQRCHDAALARCQGLQGRDRVEDGAPGGQLVVDEHQHVTPGQQRRVVGQQEVLGGVAVLLMEPADRGRSRHPPAGGVQVGSPQDVGDGVREPGRRLRVPQHRAGRAGGDGADRGRGGGQQGRRGARLPGEGAGQRRPGLAGGTVGVGPTGRFPVVAQGMLHQEPQQPAGTEHEARVGGDVLAQHRRHQQVRAPGVAPQGQAHQGVQRHADRRARRAHAHTQPRGHPAPAPHRRRGHHVGTAASRSTEETPGLLTPNTRARSSTRWAQARCGLDSFILLPYPDARTPPPAISARQDVLGVAVLLVGDHRQGVDGAHVGGVDDGLAEQAVRVVQDDLADQPVEVGGDEVGPQGPPGVLDERGLAQLRLEEALGALVVLPDRPGDGEPGAVGPAEDVHDVGDHPGDQVHVVGGQAPRRGAARTAPPGPWRRCARRAPARGAPRAGRGHR